MVKHIFSQLFVVCFITMVFQTTPFCYGAGKYLIEFGLMNVNLEGKPFVFHKTRNMELRFDKSYLHGFTVKRKGGGRFMVSYSIRFPEPVKTASIDSDRFSKNNTVYSSIDRIFWDQAYKSFQFSEGDPVGLYEMSIFVDGKLHQKITYEVEPIEVIDVSEFDDELGF